MGVRTFRSVFLLIFFCLVVFLVFINQEVAQQLFNNILHNQLFTILLVSPPFFFLVCTFFSPSFSLAACFSTYWP